MGDGKPAVYPFENKGDTLVGFKIEAGSFLGLEPAIPLAEVGPGRQFPGYVTLPAHIAGGQIVLPRAEAGGHGLAALGPLPGTGAQPDDIGGKGRD